MNIETMIYEITCRKYNDGDEELDIERDVEKIEEILTQTGNDFLTYQYSEDDERRIIGELEIQASYLPKEDRKLLEDRIKMIKPLIHSIDLMQSDGFAGNHIIQSKVLLFVLGFILNINPQEEIMLADLFYKTSFKLTDISKALKKWLDFGDLLKEYSFEKIINYDKWDKAERDEIGEKAHCFVSDYGLMGILRKTFLFDKDRFVIDVETFMKINVFTILHEIGLEKGGKMLNDTLYISSKMPTVNYLKLFFPDDIIIYPVDDFTDVDEKKKKSVHGHNRKKLLHNLRRGVFWTKYSEPVFMVLLTVKWFYNEYRNFQEYKVKPNQFVDNKIRALISFEYSERAGHMVHKYYFNSLIDAFIYYFKKEFLFKSNNWIICKECGVIEKKPRRDWKYPVCKEHRDMYKVRESRENLTEETAKMNKGKKM